MATRLIGDKITTLYVLISRRTGELLKFGITADTRRRYTSKFLADKTLIPIARGSRREMHTLERELVTKRGGRLNREPWSAWRNK